MIRGGDHAKRPDFLGIGAPRAGTTWLHAYLGQHPEIWLTPVKEVHYFDARERGDLRGGFYRRQLRKRVRRYADRSMLRDGWRDGTLLPQLAWDVHFFVAPRTRGWYRRIFRPQPGQIAGEITPAYSILGRDTVEDIREINPDLRIIYLLRDPIERSWSSLISGLARRRERSAEQITEAEFLRHAERKAHLLRADYIRTFETWGGVFGPDRICVGFLDEIREDPGELLLRLYRFLGVSDNREHIPAKLERRLNFSGEYAAEIPEAVRIHLAELYLPQLRELSERFGDPATAWLRRAEGSLSAARSAPPSRA